MENFHHSSIPTSYRYTVVGLEEDAKQITLVFFMHSLWGLGSHLFTLGKRQNDFLG